MIYFKVNVVSDHPLTLSQLTIDSYAFLLTYFTYIKEKGILAYSIITSAIESNRN